MPTPTEPEDFPRSLIVCCDGTNNTLTGGVEDTNVLKIYAYLRKHTDPRRTTLYYDPGVGTPDGAPPTDLVDLLRRRTERIAGLASGRGVYDNIEDAYRFLMTNWRGPQDRIFCFGFSRGAFTARAVVGMVNMVGLLRPEHAPLLPTLVRVYFSQPPRDEQRYGVKKWRRGLAQALNLGLARPDKAAAEPAQNSEAAALVGRPALAAQMRLNFSRPAAVHWVGVWDTVESVGLPVIASRDNPSTATFHDKPAIRNVRHVLALDEHRLAFLPRLYDAPSTETIGDRTLKQFWCPGVHCDVGGSYPVDDSGLADASLAWMIDEVADELGVPRLDRLPPDGCLGFDDLGMPRHAIFPAPQRLRHDALWDTPAWALAGMTVRDLRTRRVATIGAVERAAAAGPGRRSGGTGSTGGSAGPGAFAGRADNVGIEVDARAEGPLDLDGPSVWDRRRSPWHLFAALVVAVLALYASGWNLLDRQDAAGPVDACGRLPPWQAAPAAAASFAVQQLASLPHGSLALPAWAAPACETPARTGLRDGETWQRLLGRSPAWAMVFDLVLVGAIGYLIARVSSRTFTFYAGYRQPGQGLPWWRWIGLLPLVAVLADAGEDVATLLAVLFDAMGSAGLARAVLAALVGPLAVLKLFGYLGCIVAFVPGRVFIAIAPTRRVGQVGR